MANYKEPEFNLAVAEEDLGVYMRVYRTLKDTFHAETRMVIIHVERETYEFRLIGLTSRDTLEFCANVFAELPTETVNLVEEAQEYSLSDPEGSDEEEEDVLEGESEDEDEEEESEEEDSTNSDGETPSEEVERKLRKAKLVRRTGSSAVTVETD